MNDTAEKKKVLHVGCSTYAPHKLLAAFRNDDWQEIRLDIDPSVNPDIVSDIRDMAPVESESMDAVWSSHNIEHLHSWEVLDALREFVRVLKPGGMLMITMPNMQAIAKLMAEGKLDDPMYISPAGPISPIDAMFGFQQAIKQGQYYMAHKTAFSPQTLGKKLYEAGFEKILLFEERFDLWAYAYKDYEKATVHMHIKDSDHKKLMEVKVKGENLVLTNYSRG